LKRHVAAALLAGVLAAHAQTPPESPPATPPPAESAPAPDSPTQLPEAEQAAAPAPAAQAPPAPTAGESPPPAARAPPPRREPPKPPALVPPEGERDTEVAALRREVARLQSELDAERAAALPPEEEDGPVPPVRAAWAWLVAVALLALAGGFFLGWRLLDRRIRRKYGGLRIY
jgi:hypothetical protein